MSYQLDIDDFAWVQAALWEARMKWKNIGTRLNLGVSDLECINAESGLSLDDKFDLMIQTRLKKAEPCTWRDFYDALNHPTVAMCHVAKNLPFLPSDYSVNETEKYTENITNTQPTAATFKIEAEEEIEVTRKRTELLQKEYIDISVSAAEEFSSSVSVKKLRYSLLCLPHSIKREHRRFITKAKAEIKKVESAEDIIDVIGEHYDYLRYSLLKYVVDLYGSDGLKKKMEEYVKKMAIFMKETRLEVFSHFCPDEAEETNEKFVTMVTKHQIDWKTATLEDVEKFRVHICRELSLYDFTLNLVKVERGCVEVTWAVPRSLVAYIQHCVKPSSESMMEHHVSTLTIDGFIAYDSSFALENEYKIFRLHVQAILSQFCHLAKEMSPEDILPHLIQLRLISPSQAKEIKEMKSPLGMLYKIIAEWELYSGSVGKFPTFCAALVNAGLPHIADRLRNKFQMLMRGETVSYQQEEDEVMISGECSVQLYPPTPPGSHLVTTQMKGSTLTRSQYQNVCSLTSSLLCIPTGDLVYDGYTINPTTLYWHTTITAHRLSSNCLYTEMAEEGIYVVTYDSHNVCLPHKSVINALNACHDGDIHSLDVALRSREQVPSFHPRLHEALRMASFYGHVQVVEKLLQHGVSVDQQAQDGWNSLMMASFNGHVNVVEMLLDHGAKIDLQSKSGLTALIIASENGQIETVEKLLIHGAAVNIQKEDGWSALMMASFEGHAKVANALLQHGAMVDLQTPEGFTSLVIASVYDHPEVAEILIQYGASVDIQDREFRTSLMWASQRGHLQIVELLLKNFPILDITDENHNTALMLACMDKDNLGITSALLKAGANPNVCNKTGQTPLLLAVRKNNVAMVRELVKARVDVDHMEQGGLSALMMCCEEGNSEMAKLLLQSGANPDLQQSNTGYTALMFACNRGHLDTVIVLMQQGANSLIQSANGSTAMDIASANMFPDICTELLCWDQPDTPTADQTHFSQTQSFRAHQSVEDVVSRFRFHMDQAPRDWDDKLPGRRNPEEEEFHNFS